MRFLKPHSARSPSETRFQWNTPLLARRFPIERASPTLQGAERAVRVPGDLTRFRELPMLVAYTSAPDGGGRARWAASFNHGGGCVPCTAAAVAPGARPIPMLLPLMTPLPSESMSDGAGYTTGRGAEQGVIGVCLLCQCREQEKVFMVRDVDEAAAVSRWNLADVRVNREAAGWCFANLPMLSR